MVSLGPMSSRNGENLTEEEMAGMRRGTRLSEVMCPDCKQQGFLAGPCGGGSQNFKCANPNCGSRFNDMGPFGVQRISDPSPDAKPPQGL